MELTHEFTVPATIDETWAALNDIEGVAGCFPGATVTSVDGDTFSGSCKVKLGPIALIYNGTGTFVEKDEASHTMKIEAKGKDKRGNGTAGADVSASLVDAGGSTRVTVVTELAITGKPAQFGRGVMQDVSDKLLGQFVDCLQGRVGDASGGSVDDTGAAAGDEPGGSGAGPPSDAAPSAASTADAAPAPAARAPSAPPADDGDDALDLGAAVLPVLLKSYGKQIAAAIVGLLLLVFLVRKLRG